MSKSIDIRKLVEVLGLKDGQNRPIVLNEGQWSVLSSSARINVVAGNTRWGKSLLAGILGTAYLLMPDTRTWIVAPSYELGEKEFRYIFNFVMENLKMKESIVSYHYDVRSGNMDIKTVMGSTVQVKSADNAVSLLGEEVDFMILSEGAHLADTVWERYLRGRIINRHGRVFIPSTPAGNGGFVHKFFVRGQDRTQNEIRSFQFSCYDCAHIDPKEIEDAKENLSEEAFAEQWLGKFVAYEGLVYKDFDINKHVIDDFVIPEYWERYRSIDYGVSNPFACLWFAVSPDGTCYIYQEHYQSGMTIRDHAAVIHSKSYGQKISASFIDPSAGIKLDLMQYNIPCLDADNDVDAGIARVHEYLAKDKITGKPKLMVMRSCVKTVEEFMGYCYPKVRAGMNRKEAPIKKGDHTCDCTRYFIASRPSGYNIVRNVQEGSVEWYLRQLDNKSGYENFIGNQNLN